MSESSRSEEERELSAAVPSEVEGYPFPRSRNPERSGAQSKDLSVNQEPSTGGLNQRCWFDPLRVLVELLTNSVFAVLVVRG